jgi:hypothetical protein
MSLSLTISEVSCRIGVAASALRFDEEWGPIKRFGCDRPEPEAGTGEMNKLRRREHEIDC